MHIPLEMLSKNRSKRYGRAEIILGLDLLSKIPFIPHVQIASLLTSVVLSKTRMQIAGETCQAVVTACGQEG